MLCLIVEINEHTVSFQQACDVILSNITKRKEGRREERRAEEKRMEGRGRGDTCEACGAVSEADIKALNVLSG